MVIGEHKAESSQFFGPNAAFWLEKRLFSGVTGDDHRQPDLDSLAGEIDHKLPLVWFFKALAELEDPAYDPFRPGADCFGLSTIWLDQSEAPRHTRVSVNQSLRLQGVQMMGHGRCGGNVERLTDLAH